MASSTEEDVRPIQRDQLTELFREAEKPAEAFRIGGEAEKFGVLSKTGAPLDYASEAGVARVMAYLAEHHGWRPESETPGGPIIALMRGEASITLEPGSQLELSGAPHADVHDVVREMEEHLTEIEPISRDMGVSWLGVGFHPLAAQRDLTWVPKQRYGVMKTYLPTRGSRALDMMRRTATVQANYDYSSEQDAMQKLVVLLKLSPVIHAMLANSPFIEGKVSSLKSERGDVWLNMDPSRSGLVRRLWDVAEPTYADYVEWALDAGMFLFRRGDVFVQNTGQTFRSFLADGYEGHRATFADWKLHVNTLFPEVRLKRTIEVRGADMLPTRLIGALPAITTGLIYDAQSLSRAAELVAPLRYEEVEAARPALVKDGLAASIGKTSARDLAVEVLDIAEAGLERRARIRADGEDERVYLSPIRELTLLGRSPADTLRQGLSVGQLPTPAEVIARTRI